MNRLFLIIFSIFIINSCAGLGFSQELVRDTFVENSLANTELVNPYNPVEYNFQNTDVVTIPLRIDEKITTARKNKSYEGQKVKFFVDEDVYYNHKILVKKDTPVEAKIEIIITRGLAGIPAEIFLTDFSIDGIDNAKIQQYCVKRGFSTTTLILPIKWALTPFPPLGSLTNLAIGGNATISPKKRFYINYFPNY